MYSYHSVLNIQNCTYMTDYGLQNTSAEFEGLVIVNELGDLIIYNTSFRSLSPETQQVENFNVIKGTVNISKSSFDTSNLLNGVSSKVEFLDCLTEGNSTIAYDLIDAEINVKGSSFRNMNCPVLQSVNSKVNFD